MKKEKIKLDHIFELLDIKKPTFPKYTTQIINLANQNAKGTVPAVVGQMSELIKEVNSIGEWKEFYKNNYEDRIEIAVDKIWNMLQNLKEAFIKIDKELVKVWVEDLIYNKTPEGLMIQEFILKYLAQKNNKKYKLATPEEEAQNIDGFIGDIPIQIKPESYKVKTNVKNEDISVSIIFYKKTKSYLIIEYDEAIFNK
ncbi:type II restriction enzyme MjaI [Nautilia profundicola AmH]|uniref:Type II restriction enzyme MjaI n=1 Tax=Nautilia profundicola (strain ATCC BAA-1463 / DSM 18972 / AmH) TaxID=598659 RepID=B9L9Q1_NAUPA|nr:MjaI family restriction endonuclease [Nautilia profundicola]ACM93100.1 type II restriction enzyme MjaI [Nautilia profundicola AmH]